MPPTTTTISARVWGMGWFFRMTLRYVSRMDQLALVRVSRVANTNGRNQPLACVTVGSGADRNPSAACLLLSPYWQFQNLNIRKWDVVPTLTVIALLAGVRELTIEAVVTYPDVSAELSALTHLELDYWDPWPRREVVVDSFASPALRSLCLKGQKWSSVVTLHAIGGGGGLKALESLDLPFGPQRLRFASHDQVTVDDDDDVQSLDHQKSNPLPSLTSLKCFVDKVDDVAPWPVWLTATPLARLELDCCAFVTCQPAFHELHHLQHLNVHAAGPIPFGGAGLRGCTNLLTLRLKTVEDVDIRGCLPVLRELELENCQVVASSVPDARCLQLRSLRIQCTGLSQAWLDVGVIPKLQRLHVEAVLVCPPLTSASLEELTLFNEAGTAGKLRCVLCDLCPKLRAVTMWDCSVRWVDDPTRALFPELRRASLRHMAYATPVTPPIDACDWEKHCPLLATVHIEGCHPRPLPTLPKSVQQCHWQCRARVAPSEGMVGCPNVRALICEPATMWELDDILVVFPNITRLELTATDRTAMHLAYRFLAGDCKELRELQVWTPGHYHHQHLHQDTQSSALDAEHTRLHLEAGQALARSGCRVEVWNQADGTFNCPQCWFVPFLVQPVHV